MGKKSAESASRREDMSGVSKSERKVMEAVAKHMRFKVATKSAVIKGQKMEYFPGSKAVDCLMNSKWTSEPKSTDSEEPYFLNRAYAVEYCNKLLREKLFVRAEKVERKFKDEELIASSSTKEEKASVRKRGEKASDSPRPKKQGEEGGEKKKRKFRLDIHRQQVFIDSKEEVYFWQYDPPSYTSYMLGFAVVVGAIALTLQPLWPDSSREAVWYASMGLFFLMGGLVSLIVVRWILHGLVFALALGKLKFWVLPNLDNEKLGFFESFKPFYSVEWVKEKKKSKKSSHSKSASSADDVVVTPGEIITRGEAESAEGGCEEAGGSSDAADVAAEPQTVYQH